MSVATQPQAILLSELDILRDLMLGGRHSRTTVARMGVSLPTADRWLKALETTVPGVVRMRVGKTSWFEWRSFSFADAILTSGKKRGRR